MKTTLFVLSPFILVTMFYLGCSYQQPQTTVGSRPTVVLYPEEVGEAEVGVPMFVDYVSPNRDTVSIVFDPMKDRLFWIPNPGCKHYDCSANLIWVDLVARVIYIEDQRAEFVDFEDDFHLFDTLKWVLSELKKGKRFDKKTGGFK